MFYFGWIIGFVIVVVIAASFCAKLDKEGYLDRDDRP